MALQEEFEKQGQWLFRYRSLLPLILLLVAAGLYVRTEMNPGTFFLRDTPNKTPYYETICLLVSLLGLAIRIYTVGYTPRNTSGRNVRCQVADKLNTCGIYSIVRHPLYVGNFFMWTGLAMLTGNLWFIIAFCLFYWLYYERIMFAEEQFLRRKFGKAYTDWAASVPAFIPRFRKFRKPELPFSWKKVLKKEKNGLAALFLVFACFNIAGNLIEGKSAYNYFLLIACVASLLLYGVLKYLKKRTDLLNEVGR